MIELLENILGTDWQTAGLVVLNLIIIESLLSVDNAAVLATMVMDLPPEQRKKPSNTAFSGRTFFGAYACFLPLGSSKSGGSSPSAACTCSGFSWIIGAGAAHGTPPTIP